MNARSHEILAARGLLFYRHMSAAAKKPLPLKSVVDSSTPSTTKKFNVPRPRSVSATPAAAKFLSSPPATAKTPERSAPAAPVVNHSETPVPLPEVPTVLSVSASDPIFSLLSAMPVDEFRRTVEACIAARGLRWTIVDPKEAETVRPPLQTIVEVVDPELIEEMCASEREAKAPRKSAPPPAPLAKRVVSAFVADARRTDPNFLPPTMEEDNVNLVPSSSRPQAMVVSTDAVKDYLAKLEPVQVSAPVDAPALATPPAASFPVAVQPIAADVAPPASIDPSGAASKPLRKPTPRPAFFTMSDPIDFLFDAMMDLAYVEHLSAAVHHSLEAVKKAIPIRAAVVYLYDTHEGEFDVVDAFGPGSSVIRGGRFAATGELFETIVATKGAVTLRKGDGVALDPRHGLFGEETKEVMAVPMIVAGEIVGVIECIDCVTGSFDDRYQNAIRYVADRLGERVSELRVPMPARSGVVLVG